MMMLFFSTKRALCGHCCLQSALYHWVMTFMVLSSVFVIHQTPDSATERDCNQKMHAEGLKHDNADATCFENGRFLLRRCWGVHFNDLARRHGKLQSCTKLSMSLTLTHLGRVTHICVSKLTVTGSDNGLSPGRRHVII